MPQPISPYAVSKLAAEQYARAFATVYGLETVSLRYFNVFGPRQDPTSQYSGVVPRFMRLAIEGGRPVVFGDGRAVARLHLRGQRRRRDPERRHGRGRVGQRLQHRLRRPQDRAGPHRGREPRVAAGPWSRSSQPPSAGDVKHSFADISLAHDLLGLRAARGFRRGRGAHVRLARGRPCPACRPERPRQAASAHRRHARHRGRRPVGSRHAAGDRQRRGLAALSGAVRRHEVPADLSDDHRDRRGPRGGGVPAAAAAAGEAEVGAHLHPWTTPPFADEPGLRATTGARLSVPSRGTELLLAKLGRLTRSGRAARRRPADVVPGRALRP